MSFTITSVDLDDDIYEGQTGVIAYLDGSPPATGKKVLLRRGGVSVEQTVTAEDATTVTFTVSLGGVLSPGGCTVQVYAPSNGGTGPNPDPDPDPENPIPDLPPGSASMYMNGNFESGSFGRNKFDSNSVPWDWYDVQNQDLEENSQIVTSVDVNGEVITPRHPGSKFYYTLLDKRDWPRAVNPAAAPRTQLQVNYTEFPFRPNQNYFVGFSLWMPSTQDYDLPGSRQVGLYHQLHGVGGGNSTPPFDFGIQTEDGFTTGRVEWVLRGGDWRGDVGDGPAITPVTLVDYEMSELVGHWEDWVYEITPSSYGNGKVTIWRNGIEQYRGTNLYTANWGKDGLGPNPAHGLYATLSLYRARFDEDWAPTPLVVMQMCYDEFRICEGTGLAAYNAVDPSINRYE